MMKKTIHEILLMNPLPGSSLLHSSSEESLKLFERLRDVKQVAQEKKQAESTVFNHIIAAMKLGHPIKLTDLGINDEIRNTVTEATKKVATGLTKLTAIKLACPEDVTFEQIKAVVTYLSIRVHLKELGALYEEFEDFSYIDTEEDDKSDSLTQFVKQLEECNASEDFSGDFPDDDVIDSLIQKTVADGTTLRNDEPVVKKMKGKIISGLDSPPKSSNSSDKGPVEKKFITVSNTISDTKSNNGKTNRIILSKKKSGVKLPPWMQK